ncbi:MAG: metallophosphoesterase [Verrucomicrobia bacterium]|nr:metallophosphoesterase [Verrucomicrobiota bacterium]
MTKAYGMTVGRSGVWALLMGVAAVLPLVTQAANLLEGEAVQVTLEKSPAAKDWVPAVTFEKATRHDLRLRVAFELKTLPATPVLSLKKPPGIADWSLNGQALLGPPKDMFYPELEGIPTAALKVGTNVLEARYSVNVYLRDGKLSPASTGAIPLDLQAGDVGKFEIRTGPVLGAAGTDYFTVGCRTRMPASVTLHCDGRTWSSKPGVIHLLRADGLQPGREYEYKLVAELAGGGATAASPPCKVKTLPNKGPVTFVALGDARNNPKIWGRILSQAMKFEPAFLIHTGDIVGNGNDYEAWDREFAKPAEKFLASVPCFYTFGNHENNVAMLYQMFGFPEQGRGNYSQCIGPVQLFAMNRFENWGKGSGALVTMEKQLAASKSPFIFAFTHPPAWSSGSHGNDKLGQEIHFPIFDKYGVTALLAGHDHCYERSEPGGTTMLITGGGGAGLYGQERLKDNPHSKLYRSEYNFLVFRADDRKCEMKAYTYGGTKTPDNERKVELVDTRVWEPRAQAGGKANK